MNSKELYTLGIDIGSTTVKIAILDNENEVLFSDYERHFANIQETSWRTFCPGGSCRFHRSSGLCTTDRCSDAKIIYFENGNIEQRMNGICAGGTGSFIDQMASLLQTDATGLNEYAKDYKALYTIAPAVAYLPRQISSR